METVGNREAFVCCSCQVLSQLVSIQRQNLWGGIAAHPRAPLKGIHPDIDVCASCSSAVKLFLSYQSVCIILNKDHCHAWRYFQFLLWIFTPSKTVGSVFLVSCTLQLFNQKKAPALQLISQLLLRELQRYYYHWDRLIFLRILQWSVNAVMKELSFLSLVLSKTKTVSTSPLTPVMKVLS